MKKLLTLAVALVTAVSGWSAGTDVITVSDMNKSLSYSKKIGGEGGFAATGLTSGAAYQFISGSWSGLSSMFYITGSGGTGIFASTESGGVFKKLTVHGYQYAGGSFKVYASNEPITADNYESATEIPFTMGTSAGDYSTGDVSGQFKYMAFVTKTKATYLNGALTIEWEAAAPVETTAEAPTSSVADGAKLKAGETFTLSSTTEGAQISYKYAVADSETATIGDADWSTPDTGASPYTVTVPADAAGKWLHVSATATAEGYTESPAFTKAYEVAAAEKPQAAVPFIEGGAPASLKVGESFVIKSDSSDATLGIHYKYSANANDTPLVNGKEINGTNPYTFVVEGDDNVGKYLVIDVIATGADYKDSNSLTASIKIEAAEVVKTQAEKPTITAPTEVKVGESFTFAPAATQTDATVSYKVAISDSETSDPAYGAATEGTSYTIPAYAAGKWLYISATAGGAGYTESEATTWGDKVAEEEVGPVVAGDDVFDQSTFNAAGVTISNMEPFNVSNMPGTATGLKYSGTLFGYQNSKFGVAANEIFATTDSKNGLCVDHVTVYGPNEGWKNNVSIYVSNDPITLSNYSSATLVAKIDDNSGENWNSSSKQVDVDGDYKYVALIGGPADNTQTVLCYTKLVVSWKKVEAVEPEVGITFNNLKAQNPNANYNAEYNETDMSASTFNSQLTYEEDNVTYVLENVACGVTEGHAQWWCLNTDGGKLYNTNAVPGKHIGSIESVGAYGTMASNFTIYVGQEKLSADNVADKGTLISLSPVVPSGAPMRAAGTGSHKSWTADEYSNYQYIYITAKSLKPVASLAINWENNNIYTGVEGIEAENAEGEIYNLNGYRVSADSLVPGIYVRKANGKTVKFIVK